MDSRAGLASDLIGKLGWEYSVTTDMDGFIKLQPIKVIKRGQLWETTSGGIVCIESESGFSNWFGCIAVKAGGGYAAGASFNIDVEDLKKLVQL
jgi:hypothetical protein